VVSAPEKLLGAEDLAKLPGIGKAVYRAPNQSFEVGFPDLATHVRELVELKPPHPLPRLFLEMGIEGPPVVDIKDGNINNIYIYRVTRVSKTHEPAGEAELAE